MVSVSSSYLELPVLASLHNEASKAQKPFFPFPSCSWWLSYHSSGKQTSSPTCLCIFKAIPCSVRPETESPDGSQSQGHTPPCLSGLLDIDAGFLGYGLNVLIQGEMNERNLFRMQKSHLPGMQNRSFPFLNFKEYIFSPFSVQINLDGGILCPL